ncbi:hypothetical protein KCP78_25725 [Salmonella enterica subsp. enterica]|nr:hypothetical protein KCP78_25725 [Salmonella enterica subsp. enterica]
MFRPQRTVSKTPHQRAAERHRHRPGGRRNLDGSVRAGKGTVWLGSLRQNDENSSLSAGYVSYPHGGQRLRSRSRVSPPKKCW